MNEYERFRLTAILPYSKPRPSRYHRTNLRRKTLCRYPSWDFHCSRRECFTSWGDCTYFVLSLVPTENNHGISPRNKQDLDREDELPSTFQQAPFPEVFELKKMEDMERKKGDSTRHRNLQKHGFEGEHSGEILF